MMHSSSLTEGCVDILSASCQYVAEPLALYQQVCNQGSNTVLLESAEINNKQALKSLIVANAALKVVCNAQQVNLSALTLNGESLLPFLTKQFNALERCQIIKQTAKELQLEFAPIDPLTDERTRLQQNNAFSALRIIQQLQAQKVHPFAIMLAGVFAFDMMAIAEPLPAVTEGENSCPDYVFYLSETLIVIDHEKRSTEVIGQVFAGEHQQKYYFELSRRIAELKQNIALLPKGEKLTTNTQVQCKPTVDISDENFKAIVTQLKGNIQRGDIFQVVPSRTFSLPCQNPLLAYQYLKQANPSPYMFYITDDDFALFGASPESAIKYDSQTRQVEIYPIAGTRPRGKNSDGSLNLDLDSRIELALRQDQKELAEHIMLVDLARNDIARVSQANSRYLADFLKVDRYSHVMHIVSRVVGKLDDNLDALNAYQACMNMGTLSGAPKVKATSLIRQVEGKRRGSYGGAVGYLTGTGDMDTCIVIRSAFVSNNQAMVQAGAGVVYDSIPQAEADETRHKAQAVISAIAQANAATDLPGAKS